MKNDVKRCAQCPQERIPHALFRVRQKPRNQVEDRWCPQCQRSRVCRHVRGEEAQSDYFDEKATEPPGERSMSPSSVRLILGAVRGSTLGAQVRPADTRARRGSRLAYSGHSGKPTGDRWANGRTRESNVDRLMHVRNIDRQQLAPFVSAIAAQLIKPPLLGCERSGAIVRCCGPMKLWFWISKPEA